MQASGHEFVGSECSQQMLKYDSEVKSNQSVCTGTADAVKKVSPKSNFSYNLGQNMLRQIVNSYRNQPNFI